MFKNSSLDDKSLCKSSIASTYSIAGDIYKVIYPYVQTKLLVLAIKTINLSLNSFTLIKINNRQDKKILLDYYHINHYK